MIGRFFWGAMLGALAALGPSSASASDDAFLCTFDKGTTTSYETGKFASKAPSPLSFEISAIDLKSQSAKLRLAEAKPDRPAGTLRIVRAINANHFLEVATEGFLNLTTVYDADPETGDHPAVHSRHFGVLGQPVFAQYNGFCRVKK